MSELRHLAILAPEETRQILRAAMRHWDYSTPAAARALRVSLWVLMDVIMILGLREEFRDARLAVRARFTDPERP